MPSQTLAFSVVAAIAAATLYLYMAQVLRKRDVSADARLARDLFALWWLLLGVNSAASALQLVLYMTDHLPVWLYLTFSQFGLWCIFVALWALQVYLMYLYTGSKRSVVPLGAFYLVAYMAIVALIHWIGPPESIIDNGWQLRTEPQVELGRAFTIVFILLLLGPQIAGAVAYARLYRKTSDRTQRYRIAMLTGAILVWFGTSALVGVSSDPDEVNPVWQVFSRVLSVAAALTILAAYRPPKWVQRKYGIHSVVSRSEGRDPDSLPD